MYQRKSKLQNMIILAVDCICITVSLVLANYIRNGRFFQSDNVRMDFGFLLSACLAMFLGINLLHNTNRNFYLRGPLHELACIIQNNAVMFAGAAVFLYFLNLLDAYSRIVFFLFLLIDCVAMFISHQLLKKYVPAIYHLIGEGRKILLVTDEGHADALISDFKNMKDFTYEIQGMILVHGTDRDEISGVKVLGDRSSLVEYCKGASLDEVIVVVGGEYEEEMLRDMEILAQMGITVHYHIPVPELQSASQKILSQFGRFYMVTYANRVAPVGELILKRTTDIIGAIFGCFILLILTVILGPMIKLESKGPVFFAQKRVGRNGRIFKMYKFRSMYADAEARKAELMEKNEMNGLMFKMENDPRVTKIGRFLRKTSLDEFPQFINILKGDMSLVGTRPPTLDEFAQYSPYHKKRLSFRPGLTGMWQVSGRSDIDDFETIVRLDVEYIDNWSFLLDIKILLKTVLAVVKGSGAK